MRPVLRKTHPVGYSRFLPAVSPRSRGIRVNSVGGENPAKSTQAAFTQWALGLVDVGLKADWIRLKNRTRPDQILGDAEKSFRDLLGGLGGDQTDGFRKIMEGLQQLMGQGGSEFSKTLFPGGDPLGSNPLEEIFNRLKARQAEVTGALGDPNSPENRQKRDQGVEKMAKMGLFLTLDSLKNAVSQLFCSTAAEEQQFQAGQKKAFAVQGSVGAMFGPLFSGLRVQIDGLHAQRTTTLNRLLPLLNPRVAQGDSDGQRIEKVRAQLKAEFGNVATLQEFLVEALTPRVAILVNKEKTGPMGFFPGHVAPVTQFMEMANNLDRRIPLPPTVESFVVLVQKAAAVLADRIFNARDEGQVFLIPEGI